MDIGQMLAEKSLARSVVNETYFLPKHDLTLHICANRKVFTESETGKLFEYARLSDLPDGIQMEFWHGKPRKVARNRSESEVIEVEWAEEEQCLVEV